MESSRREFQEIFSERVKAGRRTYFFDIKSTLKNNDYYISITESKRENNESGGVFVKRTLVLYKEDLQKFMDAFNNVAYKLQDLISEQPSSLD